MVAKAIVVKPCGIGAGTYVVSPFGWLGRIKFRRVETITVGNAMGVMMKA